MNMKLPIIAHVVPLEGESLDAAIQRTIMQVQEMRNVNDKARAAIEGVDVPDAPEEPVLDVNAPISGESNRTDDPGRLVHGLPKFGFYAGKTLDQMDIATKLAKAEVQIKELADEIANLRAKAAVDIEHAYNLASRDRDIEIHGAIERSMEEAINDGDNNAALGYVQMRDTLLSMGVGNEDGYKERDQLKADLIAAMVSNGAAPSTAARVIASVF